MPVYFSASNDVNLHTIIKADIVSCGNDKDIICCHSPHNSDSQLSVESYSGSEILSQGTDTVWNKNYMSSVQEVTQSKPNQTIS